MLTETAKIEGLFHFAPGMSAAPVVGAALFLLVAGPADFLPEGKAQ